jgi:hypothetical protein
MDSIANPKVKTMEGKRVRVHSLAHNTWGVERHAGVLGWDWDERQAIHLFTCSYEPA